MQSFETDRNQVEIIEGMTIEYPYCLHQRNLTNYLNPVINNRQIEMHVIRRGRITGNLILINLYHLKELQNKTASEFQTRNTLSET